MKIILNLFIFLYSINLNAQNLESRHFIKNLDSLYSQSEFSWYHIFHGINNNLPILDTLEELNKIDTEEKYELQSVTETINELVQDDINLVILSENHSIPRSRKTLYDIIQQLHTKGFNRIYIEAMDFVDQDLVSRGYPVSKTGFYISESTFSEIIRFCLDNEIEILPYEELNFQKKSSRKKVKQILQEDLKLKFLRNEYVESSQSTFEKLSISLSARDYSQYKNILQTYDPSIKSIILCGHGHGIKKTYAGWNPLGSWLLRHPKIKLVSIENSESINQSDDALNNLMQIYNANHPFALWNTKESRFYCERRFDPIKNKKVNYLWDATILYPLNATTNNTWKSLNQTKELTNISLKDYDINTPFVLYTFIEAELESDNPIPTSAQFYRNKQELYPIYLAAKKEVIIIWDGQKKIQYKN